MFRMLTLVLLITAGLHSNAQCQNPIDLTRRFVSVELVGPSTLDTENIRLEAWQVAYNPPPFQDGYKQKWQPLAQAKLEMDGRAYFEITDNSISHVLINVVPDKTHPWIGSVKFYTGDIAASKTKQLVISNPASYSAKVLDYSSRKPVVDCDIKLNYANGFLDFEQPIGRVKSGNQGQFTFDQIDPNRSVKLSVSHPDFFSIPTQTFRIDKEPAEQILILANSDHDRILLGARLMMPQTSELEPETAYTSLTENHQKAVSALRLASTNQGTNLDQYLNRLRLLPTDLYREAMWNLLARTDDKQRQHKILEWLSNYENEGADPAGKSVKHELVRRFAHSKLLNHDNITNIRSQENPSEALTAILEQNQSRSNRACAAMQLAYHYSTGGYFQSRIKPDELVRIFERQQLQRKYLELVVKEYNDVSTPNGNNTYGARAKRYLDYLDEFGIGGGPPVFQGDSISKDLVTFGGESKSLTVLVFGKYEWSELAKLEELNKTQMQPQMQPLNLVGIGYAMTSDELESRVARFGIQSPVILDSYQGMMFTRNEGHEDQSGQQWSSKIKLGFLRNYKTIVIDRQGIIQAIGLQGKPLMDKIAELSK